MNVGEKQKEKKAVEINFYNIDCVEFMKTKPDNYYDLAIVDPPYGNVAVFENCQPKERKNQRPKKYKTKDWDNTKPTKEYFDELKRVSKNQIVWGGNYFGLVGGYIFWDKKETMPTYSKGELAWVSNMNKVDKYEFLWSGYKKQENEKRIHPTQKPVGLYKWILENYTSEGDLILDTHLGSGSIAIACHYMKRKLIAYEIDAEYYEKACKRFKQQTAQQALW